MNEKSGTNEISCIMSYYPRAYLENTWYPDVSIASHKAPRLQSVRDQVRMFPPEARATSTQMFCISEMRKKIVDTVVRRVRVIGIISRSGYLQWNARASCSAGLTLLWYDGTLRLGFKREDVSVHRFYFPLVRADSSRFQQCANPCSISSCTPRILLLDTVISLEPRVTPKRRKEHYLKFARHGEKTKMKGEEARG